MRADRRLRSNEARPRHPPPFGSSSRTLFLSSCCWNGGAPIRGLPEPWGRCRSAPFRLQITFRSLQLLDCISATTLRPPSLCGHPPPPPPHFQLCGAACW